MAGIRARSVVEPVRAKDKQALEPDPDRAQHGTLLSGRGDRAEPATGTAGPAL